MGQWHWAKVVTRRYWIINWFARIHFDITIKNLWKKNIIKNVSEGSQICVHIIFDDVVHLIFKFGKKRKKKKKLKQHFYWTPINQLNSIYCFNDINDEESTVQYRKVSHVRAVNHSRHIIMITVRLWQKCLRITNSNLLSTDKVQHLFWNMSDCTCVLLRFAIFFCLLLSCSLCINLYFVHCQISLLCKYYILFEQRRWARVLLLLLLLEIFHFIIIVPSSSLLLHMQYVLYGVTE